MKYTFIESRTLDEAWFKCLFELFDGDYYEYIIDKGSYEGEKRREFDFIVIKITNPGLYGNNLESLLPTVPPGILTPCDVKKLMDYFTWYIFSSQKGENEQYTYGERINKSMDMIIDRYKKYGYGNNQLILQIGQPDDINLDDPPCLRHIDTRIRYGKLHFMPYFRSWDLWGGLPLNLAAIQLLKEYMAEMIGVEDGEIIASSKGLHIYGHTEDVARFRAGRKK